MNDLLRLTIIMNAFCIFFLILYSHRFRKYIKENLFNGIDKNTVNDFIKNFTFKQRFFITYMKECNSTGKQRKGLAVWYIICHCIHILAVISLVIASWFEFFYNLFDINDRIISFPITYSYFLASVTIITIGALPLSVPIGLLIHLFSKNKYDLQKIRIIRGIDQRGINSGIYNVFTTTRDTAPIKIYENEIKEFNVIKGKQSFWVSESRKNSNELEIYVLDSIVELEVGCDINENLWIREKNVTD
ncbi:MAG: hypothetical protein FWC09_03590 [Lachnospiraceae bacterium]|nr:hypothetical protein [Lachnospiraceae bacterium]